MTTRSFMAAKAIAAGPAFVLLLASVLGFGLVAHSKSSGPHYAPQKVVYHNNGRGPDSAAYFTSLLRNLANHIEAVGAGRIDFRVVDHGDGVKLLQMAASDPALAARIDALRAKGVRFLVCANTLQERNIDWHTLYGVKEEDLVPSGVAELIALQQQGFAYVHP